jgi:hypothetical protein
MRPEELCQRKIPMTLSGIEPATYLLLAQCLNQLHHHVAQTIYTYLKMKTVLKSKILK